MTESPLARKMYLKPGHRVLVKNAPDGYIDDRLAPLPEGAEISTSARGQFDAAQFFVKSQAEFRKLVPQLEKLAKDDRLIWVAYPKQTSGVKTDLNRDRMMEICAGSGIRGVAMISIDETWSSARFRARQT
jgi:hypothetical protein